jgi:hypothetical protein
MKTAETRAKMSLYVIASVALLRFKFMKAIFDHWVSKDIRLLARFIVKRGYPRLESGSRKATPRSRC